MCMSAVVPCGGKGERMGIGQNKLFLPLLGEPLIAHTLRVLGKSPYVGEIILSAAKGEEDRLLTIYESLNLTTPIRIVAGGKTRQASVKRGVEEASYPWVLVHDGARALLTEEIIEKTVTLAKESGGAAAGILVKDTLKRVNEEGQIAATVDREHLVRIQTPQVFPKSELLLAYKLADEKGFVGTDECSLMEFSGHTPKVAPGAEENIKITTMDDVVIAEAILKGRGK